ncbi:MAG TPA: hypothetical protein VF577_03495 [Allosphingosinicella sp.]
MRRSLSFLPLLLCACGAQDSMSNNGANSTGAPATTPEGGASPATAPVQTATLTGRYESGPAERRNQMCVIEGDGRARFGLVVQGSGSEGCSGSGTAARQGQTLRLTMTGDEACTIDVRIDGTRVAFPASLPAGCAYYCSRGASFAGAAFDKTGGSAEDALRAQDLVGDRLCAGMR